MGKLINRIPGSRLLVSSLPGSALRTHVESLVLFVWCLTTHQPLWVISVRRFKLNMMWMEIESLGKPSNVNKRSQSLAW